MRHTGIRQYRQQVAFLFMVLYSGRKALVSLMVVSGMLCISMAGTRITKASTDQIARLIPAPSDKDQQPAAYKKYPSLLWEISKTGIKKKSYLYGTMHVSRKLAFRLSDTFFLSVNNADIVALETDPGNWIRYLAEDRQGPAPWQQWMNMAASRDYNRAWSVTHPTNNSLAFLIRHEESLADAMLYRRDERQADFSEDTYLDLFIYQAGKKLGKEVIGLEDYRESRLMVARSRMPDRNEETRETRRPRISRWEAAQQLEEAYRSGDLDLIDSLDRLMSPGKQYRKWMLTERNRVMAIHMNRLMESGKSLFAGVGAAHLPGDSGMIEMLRSMGYTVRPVSARSSALARKQKEKIESLEFKQGTRLYTSAQGDFEAQLSAAPFQMAFPNGTMRYFLPDPANGAYVLLSSVPYYGAFTGQSREHMIQRLDSLLFENVRGKILTKAFTTQNGFPAIDIRNRTAQGDLQRLLLVVTPTRVWTIKMSGQGEYAAGKAAENFFGSLRLLEAPGFQNKWVPFQPEAGGYSILWPGEPKFSRSLGDSTDYLQGHRDMEATDLNGHYYFLRRIVMHDVDYVEDDTFELAWLARSLATDLKCKIIQTSYLKGYGSPALEARISPSTHLGRPGIFRLAFYGTAVYAWGTTDTGTNGFLESFTFTPFRYKHAFKTIRDSSLWFSTVSSPQPDLLKAQKQMGRLTDEESDSFDRYRYLNRQFSYSASTGEIVNVYLTRYHFFKHETGIDSMWRRRILLNLENNFSIYKEHRGREREWETLDLHYSDTASIRVIRAKWYVRGRMSWCVAACYDTVHGQSPLIRSFFDSFTPFDTFASPSVFTSRTDSLLRMMQSNDSTTRAVSRKWSDFIELIAQDVPTVMRQIRSADKDQSSLSYRINLIEALGKIRHPDILPFLKSFYLQSGDTGSLQIAVLKALASQHTPEAARMFADLLLEETPLTQDHSDGSDIIDALRDSLSVNKQVMPQLLELLRYPDYRSDVLDLLCTMVDSNVVVPAEYAAYKKSLTLELRDGWKRLKSDETAELQNNRTRFNQDAADLYRYDGTRGNVPADGSYPEDAEVGDVLRCCRLLLPLLPDPAIAHRVEALFSSKDQMFRLMVAEQWLKAGIRIPDSLVINYLNKPLLRWGMLRLMAAYPKIIPLPDSLRRGVLIAESYARFDELGSRDSLKFIQADTVIRNGYVGLAYHFHVRRYKDATEDKGLIYSVWLDSALSNAQIVKRPYVVKIRIDDSDLMATCAQQNLRLSFENRKRWKPVRPGEEEDNHFWSED